MNNDIVKLANELAAKHGGRYHGPNIEHLSIQQADYYALVKELVEARTSEAVCEDCHGTGQMAIGRSGLESDGNAIEYERCPSCGYGDTSTNQAVREFAEKALPYLKHTQSDDGIICGQLVHSDNLCTCGLSNLKRALIETLPNEQAQSSQSSDGKDGWKLVPIEPTDDMIDAGRLATANPTGFTVMKKRLRAAIAAAPLYALANTEGE